MNYLRTLYREPLLHFLVLAVGLFVLHAAVSHEDPEGDARRIVVDETSLLTFIQYRTKSFEPVTAKQQLESFSADELDQVIADYVREEALYREARNLGLGDNDYVIKRRLVQKIDYVARGFAESIDTISEADVAAFFAENRDDYYVEPRITFTHVYFGFDQHGPERARELAAQKLAELESNEAGFNDASRHGDRFLYGLNYVERSKLYVESHFGTALTEEIFAQAADNATWRGPIQSDHGAHLVMVSQLEPGRMPELAEVRARVEQEANRARVAERTLEATRQIVEAYEIERVYRQPDDNLVRLGNEIQSEPTQ